MTYGSETCPNRIRPVLRRVDDVLRLILAGAEFADIRQYASEQGWQVSERQVRRYQEAAYLRLAETADRDREQLRPLNRHVLRRRFLTACRVLGWDRARLSDGKLRQLLR